MKNTQMSKIILGIKCDFVCVCTLARALARMCVRVCI